MCLGPDHVAVIMAVSACQGSAALWYGVRWGVGHSTGLILVALVMWLIEFDRYHAKPLIMKISSYCSGAFMILFGLYFLREMPWVHGKLSTPRKRDGNGSFEPHDATDSHSDKEIGKCMPEEMVRLAPTIGDSKEFINLEVERSLMNTSQSVSIRQAAASLFAGLFGGLAGPGGLLAIVPASYCSTKIEAILYIGIFIVSSTAAMGLCALAYGRLTAGWVISSLDRQRQEARLRLISSSSCIVVGVVLLILTFLDVYP